MTASELLKYFNKTYGITKEWPRTFEVDADTYANCCQVAFNNFQNKEFTTYFRNAPILPEEWYIEFKIKIEPHHGLMFKGVELILKSK